MALREVTIVGGGLAGLTLGIGLRAHEVPVVVHEAGHYPRHRVCGEFLSGKGESVLREMGLLDRFFERGAGRARSALFGSPRQEHGPLALPEPAVCLSRYRMDALLAETFRESGGDLRAGSRYRPEQQSGPVVWAAGRRVRAPENGRRGGWLGLKAHAIGVELKADLELHLVPHGYVGLCRVGPDKVNVCGLFAYRKAIRDLNKRWPRFLSGSPGSPLSERLRDPDFDAASFCSVTGFRMGPQPLPSGITAAVGDAYAMIPPLTGNGMSMAFEAASLAIDPLLAYSRNEISWDEAARHAQNRCGRRFRPRLRWANWLQWAWFSLGFGGWIMGALANSDRAWQRAFRWAR